MKKQEVFTDRIYRLKKGKTPLNVVIASRHSKRSSLLYFDEKKGVNRPLRYASNQKSPFMDEQDGEAIVSPIIFVDGMLRVSKKNPVLQKFLELSPQNGSVFVEVNTERDAQAELEAMDLQDEASEAAKNLNIAQLETIARVALKLNVDKMKSPEIKRDVRMLAKKDPENFLAMVNDPKLDLLGKCASYFDQRVLTLRNKGREIFFNLPNNKKKLLTVPFGESPVTSLSAYLQSDDGIETMRLLDGKLEL